MAADLIHCDPEIALGKPVVRGTRITVEFLLEKLGAGESIADLLRAHPRLTEAGVRAALLYAAAVLRCDVVLPSGGNAA
jgi:uncharacterized protein (DUF433 family)